MNSMEQDDELCGIKNVNALRKDLSISENSTDDVFRIVSRKYIKFGLFY